MANKTIIDTIPPSPNKRVIGGSNQRSTLRTRLQSPTSWKYNHAPISGLENENASWWQHRAERYATALSSSGDNLYSRQAVQREALRNLDHSRNFKHDAEFADVFYGGSNQPLNKKRFTDKITFNEFESYLDISDEVYPGIKKRASTKATLDGESFVGVQVLPFSAFSSSVSSGYQGLLSSYGFSGLDFANLHDDKIQLYGGEVPMQGPFTERYVGGIQARHNAPLRTSERKEQFSISLDGGFAIATIVIGIGGGFDIANYNGKEVTLSLGGVDFVTEFDTGADIDESTESVSGIADALNVSDVATALKNSLNAAITAQGLRIFVEPYSSGATIFVSSRIPGPSVNGTEFAGSLISSIYGSTAAFAGGTPPSATIDAISGTNPRGQYLRGHGAKAPINIQNIETLFTSDSVRVVGNYIKKYETVQTVDRSATNMDFAYNSENYAHNAPTAFLTTIEMRALDRTGSADYPAPRQVASRKTNKTIIAGRFSSPGSKTDSSQLFRDVRSDQFSPNNALPFRNVVVRKPFIKDLGTHTGQGGYLGTSTTVAALEKTQRNSTQRLEIDTTSPTLTFVTGTQYDTYFCMRPIPAGDSTQWFYSLSGSDTDTYSKYVLSGSRYPALMELTKASLQFPVAAVNAAGTVTAGSGLEADWNTKVLELIDNVSSPRTVEFTFLSAKAGDSVVQVGPTEYQLGINGYTQATEYAQVIRLGVAQANADGNLDIIPTPVFIASAIVELTQGTAGSGGNTTIGGSVIGGAATTTNFTGGSDAVGTYYGPSVFTGSDGLPHFIWTDYGTEYSAPWTQLRAANKNVARFYRKNNLYEISPKTVSFETLGKDSPSKKFDPSTSQRVSFDQTGNSRTSFYSKRFYESPISSKYKPLRHTITTSVVSEETGKKTDIDVGVDYSYGTSLLGFANQDLNTEILGSPKHSFGKVKRPYEILREQASDELSRDLNDIKTIKQFIYEETIYPKDQYTYMSGSRSRLSFDNNFWRDNKSILTSTDSGYLIFTNFYSFRIDDIIDGSETSEQYNSQWYRIRTGLTNSQGYGARAQEQSPYSFYDSSFPRASGPGLGSIWPLDSFLWSDQISVYEAQLTGTFNTPVLLADQSTLGSGELMTPYFYAVDDNNTNAIDSLNGLTSSYGTLGTYQTNIVSAQYVHTTAHVTGAYISSPNEYQPEPRVPGNVYTLPKWTAGGSRRYIDGPLRGQLLEPSYPFYNSYEKYVEDIRLVGKDHTIIPEFRVSEHIQEYKDNASFLSVVESSLELTGASRDIYDSTSTGFYDRYATTDQMQFLEDFMSFNKSDKNYIFNKFPRQFEISSDAVVKLLPYEGFYPVNRTLQIATHFSESYSSSFQFEGTNAGERRALRTVLRPFFSPGILYNSIKSGVAVDYPVRRADRDYPLSWALINPEIFNRFTNKELSKMGSPLYNGGLYALTYEEILALDDNIASNGLLPSNSRRLQNMNFGSDDEGTINKALFYGDRLPFDSILAPENYLSTGSFSPIISNDSTDYWQYVYASASIEPSALTDTSLYKKSISNFLANVPHFFLKNKSNRYGHDGKLTKFVSQFGSAPKGSQEASSPERKVSVDSNSAYMMEIGLIKTDQFNLYSNPHAFGPATFTHAQINTWDTLKASGSFVPNHPAWPKHRGEFAPFTAPYYYGPSVVRITFMPNGTKEEYTLDEIINNDRGEVFVDFINESGSYYDINSGSFVDSTGAEITSSVMPGYGWNRAWLNRMDIDASIFINNEFETGNGNKYKSSDPNKWTIMTKWESPILDFPNRPVSDTSYNFSSSVTPGQYTQTTQGMWHQYGVEPQEDSGVYLYIKDIPTGEHEEYDLVARSFVTTLTKPVPYTDFSGSYHYVKKTPKYVIDSGRTVESLADLCGFDPKEIIRKGFDPKKAKRLGQLADDGENSISEAILALPFYLDDAGSPRLVNVQAPANKLGPKIKEFRKNFTKYSLPPSLSYKLLGLVPKGYPQVPDVINPFGPDEYDEALKGSDLLQTPVVYLMEHKVSLSKQDLADIWQNVMPDISRKMAFSYSAIDHYMPGDNIDEKTTQFPEVLREQIKLGVVRDGHPRYDLLDIAEKCSDGFVPEIRWLVFKVKQRGITSYEQLIAEEVDGPNALGYDNSKELMSLQGLPAQEIEKILGDRDEFSKQVYIQKHSLDSPTYNWPYDYCSLIELAKINAKVGFRPELDKEYQEEELRSSLTVTQETSLVNQIEAIAKNVKLSDNE